MKWIRTITKFKPWKNILTFAFFALAYCHQFSSRQLVNTNGDLLESIGSAGMSQQVMGFRKSLLVLIYVHILDILVVQMVTSWNVFDQQ